MPKEAIMVTAWRCRIRFHRWQRLRNPKAAGTADAAGAEDNGTALVGQAAEEVLPPTGAA